MEIKLEVNSQENQIIEMPAPQLEKPVEEPTELQKLTPEEQQMVKAFLPKIDVYDSQLVLSYGASAQNKIAQFSDNVLKSVKTKDLGEVGQLLSDLVVEIKTFDSTTEQKKGVFGIFGGVKTSVDKMMAQFQKVEFNIDKIVDNLQNHKIQLMKDITMFDGLYKTNLDYFKELTLYIIAGDEKLKELNEVTIPQMQKQVQESGDEIEAQKLNDLVNLTNRFEKKIHDLKLSRMISLQTGPQIRIIQNNDNTLVQKIQSSIVNSIPLWKNQMVITMGLANAKSALGAQTQVTNMTNELLRRNSEMLKQGSVEIAKETERGIVDIETLQQTNKNLIETITEVINIQREGSQKRAAAENELQRIEGDLKQALISASTNR